MSNPEDKAKEIERALEERKDADQAFNDKLDKIFEAFDGVTKQLDGVSARVDAMETSRKDAKGAEETADESAAAVAGKGRSDAIKRSQILSGIQARADSVSHMFGSSAPPPMMGEAPHAYRIRLLKSFQHNSPEFKEVDLVSVGEGATFDAIENRIYADSTRVAACPLVPVGHLHEVKTRDSAGRTISKFHGEPGAWMSQFMSEPALVERINK